MADSTDPFWKFFYSIKAKLITIQILISITHVVPYVYGMIWRGKCEGSIQKIYLIFEEPHHFGDKFCFQKPHVKIMLIALFYVLEMIHKEFISIGQTLNAEFYKGVVDRLLKRIAHIFIRQTISFSCTIMLHCSMWHWFGSFWWKKKMVLCYTIFHILQILIPLIIFSSQVETEIKRAPFWQFNNNWIKCNH